MVAVGGRTGLGAAAEMVSLLKDLLSRRFRCRPGQVLGMYKVGKETGHARSGGTKGAGRVLTRISLSAKRSDDTNAALFNLTPLIPQCPLNPRQLFHLGATPVELHATHDPPQAAFESPPRL